MFNEKRGMSTPWGTCQNKTVLARGVFTVSTAGHGGLAVSRALALRLFQREALRLAAFESNGYFWFEEDCAISLALVDSRHILDLFCDKMQWDKTKTHLNAIQSVERWYPDYYKGLKQVDFKS
jgi:hypothetical protein